MSALIQNLKKLRENLIILNMTRKIEKEDLELPEYYELQEDYRQVSGPVEKAVISIKNSIITQRRVVFCLTREDLRHMVNKDRNHKSSVGLSNDNYKAVLALSMQSGLITLVKEGSKRTLSVYKVSDKNMLDFLQISEESQMKEVLDFVERNNTSDVKPDLKSDHKPDLVGSREYTVESIQYEVGSTENTQSSRTEKVSTASSSGTTASASAPLSALEQVATTPAKTVIKFEASAAAKNIQDQKKESCAKERKGNQEPNADGSWVTLNDQDRKVSRLGYEQSLLNQDDVRMIESAVPKNEWENTFLEACKQAVVQFGSLTDGKRRVLARMQSPAASEPAAKQVVSVPAAAAVVPAVAVSLVKKPLEGAAVSSIMYSKLSAEDKAKKLSEYTWASDEKVADCLSLYSTSQEEIETIISSLNLPFTETVKKRIKTINNQFKRAQDLITYLL